MYAFLTKYYSSVRKKTIPNILAVNKKCGYSHITTYNDELDNIIGIVLAENI